MECVVHIVENGWIVREGTSFDARHGFSKMWIATTPQQIGEIFAKLPQPAESDAA
jgi:hypothetical protein